MGKGGGREGAFTSTMWPAGKDLGSDGPCETGTWVELGKGAGKAMDPVTTTAATEARTESFIVNLCVIQGARDWSFE